MTRAERAVLDRDVGVERVARLGNNIVVAGGDVAVLYENVLAGGSMPSVLGDVAGALMVMPSIVMFEFALLNAM